MIFELVSSAVNMKDTWREGVLCFKNHLCHNASFPDAKHAFNITPVQKKTKKKKLEGKVVLPLLHRSKGKTTR